MIPAGDSQPRNVSLPRCAPEWRLLLLLLLRSTPHHPAPPRKACGKGADTQFCKAPGVAGKPAFELTWSETARYHLPKAPSQTKIQDKAGFTEPWFCDSSL